MRRAPLLVAVLLLLGSPNSARAVVLDFEDLYTGSPALKALPANYGGYAWQGALWITKNYAVPSGYHNTIKGQVGILTGTELRLSMGGSTFSVPGMTLGAAWNDNQGVWVRGYRGGALVSETYLIVGYFGSDVTLGCCTNVDTFVIKPDGTGTDHSPSDNGKGHQVVVDDIALETGGGEPPVADAGPDQTVEQATAAGTEVTLDGSASTGDGALTFEWLEGTTLLGAGETIAVMLPLGEHAITLQVTDGAANADCDEVLVAVQDTTPPVIEPIVDITVEQGSPDGRAVEYSPTATDLCDADVEVSLEPPSGTVFPLGQTAVACTAADDSGNTAVTTFTVTVEDTTPPGMALVVTKSTLWPANHKMHLCAQVTGISDACDADPTVDITVTSNEPINGPDDGNTEPDWAVVRNGDVWEIWLRAERCGSNGGRVYTIIATVTDDSGNVTAVEGTVTVPHDQGNGKGKK